MDGGSGFCRDGKKRYKQNDILVSYDCQRLEGTQHIGKEDSPELKSEGVFH